MAVNEDNEDQRKGRAIGRISSQAGLNAFAGGFIAGAQNRMFGASDAGQQDGGNPSWQENNREAFALNTKIMAASAQELALMDRDIAAMTDPADVALRVQLIAARDKALEGFRAMQESMAHDQVNVDVQAGAHTDADVQALRQTLGQLQGANEQMRSNQQQPVGVGPRAKGSNRAAPVRNADGMTLADLTAPAPGEDPLPGTSQPLVLDALDAVQGIPPRSAAKRIAKGVSRAVVMNPAHVAGLASLEDGRGDSLESEGSGYNR